MINTKSSIKAELVGVDDLIKFLVWEKVLFEYQMKEHGNFKNTKVIGKSNIILQDNTNMIQL